MPDHLLAQRTPRANPDIVCRVESDDWAILFDPDSGKAYGIGPVSLFIWRRLDGDLTLEEVVRALERTFAEVPADVRQHVAEFVDRLVDIGFANRSISIR